MSRLDKSRAALALLLALAAAMPAAAEAPLSRTESVLWTNCTVTLYDHASGKLLDESFLRLREIDQRMSTDTPGSQLQAVDAAAGLAPVHVSDDLFYVTQKALQLAAATDGLFDPTVGPLIKVWRINKDNPDVPAQAEIDAARALVNWRDVVIDDQEKTILLKRPSMQLDLGGMVKGYAADEVARILTAGGVKSALINLGGDIFALGNAPSGFPWRIGVQNPESERGSYIGIATITNESVVTSGIYEHYFIKNGKRYHHIMDTRTGYPVDNGLTSVTVMTSHSIDADGLGLAIFCLGKEEGLKFARKQGVGVVIVDEDHKVYVTPETRKLFRLTDTSFTYGN